MTETSWRGWGWELILRDRNESEKDLRDKFSIEARIK